MKRRIEREISRLFNRIFPCKRGRCHNKLFGCQCGDIGQMITPPKSKSPWEAMTAGSTGGWAKPFAPGESMGFVGPLLTTAMGAIPGVGPALSAGMGAAGMLGAGGFQGTDVGWGNVLPTMLGAAGGYGLGTLGAGIRGGVESMLTGATQMGTPGMQGPMGTMPSANLFARGFGQEVTTALQPFSGLLGGAAKTGTAATTAAGAGGTSSLINPATLMGIGGMALSRLPTTPTPPRIGPTVSQWLTKGAITKAGKLAETIQETEYMGDFELDKETQAYMQAVGGEIDKAYDQRISTMDTTMSAMNPHWKFSGERLEMVRRVNEERQNKQNLMRSEWVYTAKRQYAQNKYNTVMASLNVDETVKRELLFANLSDIMWKYQLDREDVLELREMARDAGMYLFERGVASTMG